jgi:predicted DNA-binding transcriptional regulator AlpA
LEAELKKPKKVTKQANRVAAIAIARKARQRHRVPGSSKEAQAARAVINAPYQLLTRTEVLARCGVSYQTILNAMRAGLFPRARRMLGRTVWISTEVDNYCQSLPLQELKGAPEPEAATPQEQP